MSTPLPPCPACSSNQVVRNGRIHNGKQNFKCRACSRQFVQDPQNKVIDQASQDLIDKLLLEKISLAGFVVIGSDFGELSRTAELAEILSSGRRLAEHLGRKLDLDSTQMNS